MVTTAQSTIDSFTNEYRFLSNFFPFPITYNEVTYPTNEHAFVAMKTLDLNERRYVAKIPTPGQAKRYGRDLTLRSDWDEIKQEVMGDLLVLKFQPTTRMGWNLAMTCCAALVEGNHWHDQYWGDCRCGSSSCIQPGMNVLGRLLVERRSFVQRVGGWNR